MDKYHKRGELAPRDDVARSIFLEIESGKQAFLDCRKAIGDKFPKNFPTVFDSCMDAGIDPRNQLIPIAPAVHYHMDLVTITD